MNGKRSQLTYAGAKRLFEGAYGVHKKNLKPRPMRGGIRL